MKFRIKKEEPTPMIRSGKNQVNLFEKYILLKNKLKIFQWIWILTFHISEKNIVSRKTRTPLKSRLGFDKLLLVSKDFNRPRRTMYLRHWDDLYRRVDSSERDFCRDYLGSVPCWENCRKKCLKARGEYFKGFSSFVTLSWIHFVSRQVLPYGDTMYLIRWFLV